MSDLVPYYDEEDSAANIRALTETLRQSENGDVFDYLEQVAKEHLTPKMAKKIIAEMVYQLMYEVNTERGYPHSPKEAQVVILERCAWLAELAGYEKVDPLALDRLSKKRADEKWEENFDGRARLAAERMRDRLLEMDRLLPRVVSAIMNGDIEAVNQYVALAKLDAGITGYMAPTKYEVAPGAGDDFLTPKDKEMAQRAAEHVREFERLLEDGGEDALLEDGEGDDDEEV